MRARTNVSIEAVAAFLYNAIYDQDAGEGWTPDEPGCDPSYCEVFRCFAEAIMNVLETNSVASPKEVIQKAVALVDHERAGYGWEFIVMDEKLVPLPEMAEPHIEAVRAFLETPESFLEGEFLRRAVSEDE